MPCIKLGIALNERLGITSVTIDYNDTGLPDDSDLIQRVAFTMLKSLHLNKESVMVQDLLNEIGIERITNDDH